MVQYFYGIKPFKFIWHGEWADPEVEYKGYRYNYSLLEDTLLNYFKEDCPDGTDEGFVRWLRSHKYIIEETIHGLMRFEIYDNKNLYFTCETIKAAKQNASRYFNSFDNAIDEMTIYDRELCRTFKVIRINKKYPNGEIIRGKWSC